MTHIFTTLVLGINITFWEVVQNEYHMVFENVKYGLFILEGLFYKTDKHTPVKK